MIVSHEYPAVIKLLEHLLQSFGAKVRLLGLCDPSNVFAFLVRWSGIKIRPNLLGFQRPLNILRKFQLLVAAPTFN